MVLGGLVIATLGGISEYVKENQLPGMKTVVRDFIIGVVLVGCILQMVPDSMVTLMDSLPSLKEISSSMPSMTGGGSVEPDLQVGPARF
jgi:hypothetical protein